MDNFWSFLLYGVSGLIDYVMSGIFPPHTNIGLTASLLAIATNWIVVEEMMIFSYVNFTVPAIIAIFMFGAEAVRAVVSAIMLVVRLAKLFL